MDYRNIAFPGGFKKALTLSASALDALEIFRHEHQISSQPVLEALQLGDYKSIALQRFTNVTIGFVCL